MEYVYSPIELYINSVTLYESQRLRETIEYKELFKFLLNWLRKEISMEVYEKKTVLHRQLKFRVITWWIRYRIDQDMRYARFLLLL